LSGEGVKKHFPKNKVELRVWHGRALDTPVHLRHHKIQKNPNSKVDF
jgi:hypothetical protein